MKVFYVFQLFFVLALFAMASAQRGKHNNPEQVHFVDNANPGQGRFWGNNRPTPVQFVDNNNPGGVNFVNNPYDNNPGQVNFVNNDPNNPSGVNFVNNNPNNPSGVNFVNNNPNDPSAVHIVDGNPDQVVITNPDPFFGQPSYPQRPDISPVYVNRPYPGKQYDNPYARGGK
ncbi:rasGEF domain-containing serine/threonine-protein kinase X-like isoform X23 [Spodoptera litura]|uniref:RasGEF domain-containing serine/threonine-protein kinase X-like isoform X23 n=1 Tax=Spodoptera litura TaxID=69820 RepID=A0A9J7E7T1_SPOLT|nr:rasGEF domain-containing serine/threonine-protein kinase X-like isoform X23 [Spodoptera litura]